MSLEMAHKVILPPKKNYIPQFLKQRDINSYFISMFGIRYLQVMLEYPVPGPALGDQLVSMLLEPVFIYFTNTSFMTKYLKLGSTSKSAPILVTSASITQLWSRDTN
jgi:hypothetical protein